MFSTSNFAVPVGCTDSFYLKRCPDGTLILRTHVMTAETQNIFSDALAVAWYAEAIQEIVYVSRDLDNSELQAEFLEK